LANAAESLDRVLGKLDAQQEALNAKVDCIVAAVEGSGLGADQATGDQGKKLGERVAELEKANTELKAQTTRMARKTLSPLVASLLSKNGTETGERLDPEALNKTLHSLTVDQRIAVKAEMARAGMID
jgi:hypothetical protein